MKLEVFNQLSKEEATIALTKCCASSSWVNLMVDSMPFASADDLVGTATSIWFNQCSDEDFLEAFSGHPKIGDMSSHKEKYKDSKDWAGMEQAAVADAVESVFNEIERVNDIYEEKFGYIFVVSATGKTAEEMVQLLSARVTNDPSVELRIAMGEQHKITCIRLVKLIEDLAENSDQSSHVTTHVLDTSTGKPGSGMIIRMKFAYEEAWETLALSVTNADGRIGDLLPPGLKMKSGNYMMVFDTGAYYNLKDQTGFYPEVSIQFTIVDESHYHIPLLLNPYGFTTYRGS